MENSRLIAVAKTLGGKEIRAFRKFLKSPYFNQREDLVRLFQLIELVFLKKNSSITKEATFEQLYPNQEFDVQFLRQSMSLLLKQLELFLVLEEHQKDQLANKLTLSKIFRERELHKPFQSSLKELKKLQQNSSYRNAQYFEDHFKIMLEEYQFRASNRISEQNLQQISDSMDMAFILSKLRQACYSIAHQTVYKTEYRFGLLDAILDYIKKNNLDQHPTLAIYYYCYHALLFSRREEYFQLFRAHLFANEQLFHREEIRDLYLLAINFCIRRFNQGEENYAREGLDWYRRGLESKVLLNDGVLSRFTYRNVVAMGLKVGDFNWVQSFIHEYKPVLEKQYRENMFSFNLAKLEYHRKNYQEALHLLRKAKYKDLLLNLGAKTLLLKIYYELDDWDMLEAHLEAMQNYLRRKKVMGYHQTNYQNLIKYTKKLVHISPYDKAAREKFKKRIEVEEILTEKEWLLNQLVN